VLASITSLPVSVLSMHEAHLDDPSGPHLPDIVPVERQVIEFIAVKLQLVVIQRDQLPFPIHLT
jgi:hypothetical protein